MLRTKTIGMQRCSSVWIIKIDDVIFWAYPVTNANASIKSMRATVDSARLMIPRTGEIGCAMSRPTDLSKAADRDDDGNVVFVVSSKAGGHSHFC
jgi:hypothetical protein